MSDSFQLYFYSIIYGLSLVISLLNIKKYNHLKGWLFILFLLLTTITEICGAILINNALIKDSIYLIYTIINFYLWYFFYHIIIKENKSLIKFISLFYTLILIYEIYALKSYTIMQTKISFYFGSISLLVLTMKYFYELLKSDKILYNYKILYFWISLGLVLTWITYIPILHFIESGLFKENYMFMHNMTKLSTFIGNFCYIIGILWSQKKHNY
jgi:hypothetical protein